ncbi:RluA family pseudouridine synthase [Streptococcus chenjunshii]|uniref:RNA pseudouridylate synthase n=1 Tax=Streptococcus chenjunshii TaxID=2173853 RepID=A0A372KL50_9STRE|nr:RluA family pseudouridine synthase [Streptococcus chenjunshii]AXQ77744.1 RluA family pseudouridine synthase [Streptococcus chenjunshii]RFU50155.1 RluA family pseudouridine synthase [Streptococcus chenjunshii]RFU52308.1 RluA family pseudouridine synthase [Streptococcus chenjunshii]
MTFAVTIINPYESCTVKELLEKHLLIPRKIRHFLRSKKHVWLNGQPVHWQNQANPGDTLYLQFDEEDYPVKTIIMGDKKQVHCLYEDEHIIIVNKEEGMKTHGNEPGELALLNHVSAYAGQTCYVVHRLDKETSGALMFAKNPFILPILNRLLEDKQIVRHYLALAQGQFPLANRVYKEKIGRDRHDRRKRLVDQKGQSAITKVKRLAQYRESCLLDCSLETGRTHQIRVHLAHHGHAVIGDPLYSTVTCSRLMLHAYQLSFRHPLTLKSVTVKAESASFKTMAALWANET